jgi:hypothetical protein
MSWLGKSKNTVTVEFIVNGTSNPFAISEVPIEQLPDTFELETNLEIGQQQWSVTQAVPNKKEEFTKTGKLKVFLNKVQTIDPKELLFSLPTINDSIFEIETTTSGSLFSIHEDDWRQMEFISKKYDLEVAQEMKSVVEIYEQHKIGIGFDQVHIRKIIEQPLHDEKINFEVFIQNFNVIKKYDGFGIGNNKAKDSFAFQIEEGTILYGQAPNSGGISFLCVAANENSKQSIEEIAEKYNLIFVDWCRAEIINN